MTWFLIDEPPRLFLPTLAERIGVNQAIVVQQMHWTSRRDSAWREDGLVWVNVTTAEWRRYFRFWSDSTISRIFKDLRDAGLIEVRKGRQSSAYALHIDRLQAVVEAGQSDDERPSDCMPGTVKLTGPRVREKEEIGRERIVGDADRLFAVGPDPAASTAAADERDPAQEVWDHYVAVFQPARPQFSPSRRRMIEKALKECGSEEDLDGAVEHCKRAIEGLKSWRQQRPGDTSLSSIFVTRPNGSSLGDQIQFFVSQVGTQAVVSPEVPTVLRDRVVRRRVQVQEMVTRPDASGVKERGAEALAWLREHANEEPIIEGDKITGWRKIPNAV